MKALNLRGINDLHLEEMEIPELQEGWSLVKVHNVGICGSDIPRIYQTGAHRHPLVPGHEFAGEVVEKCASGEIKTIGRRVGIFPLIPCGECPQCKKKQYEMCQNYDYLGSRCDGGFAEYVAVPDWNLMELPEEVSYEDAAMLEPTAVACHAIRQLEGLKELMAEEASDADVIRQKSVAVCGLGTIGLLIVMLLKGMGMEKVYAIGNKEIQREKAISLGVDSESFCDTRITDAESWLRRRP